MSVERIGIVGGGQLGRMLTEAAKPMGFEVKVVDPTMQPVEGMGEIPYSPALQAGAEQIVADLDDGYAIRQLAESVDVVTWEIEHINTNVLFDLVGEGIDIQPSPLTLNIIKDKLKQKRHLSRTGIPVVPFFDVQSEDDLRAAVGEHGEIVVKSRFGGYDGGGNLELDTADWGQVINRFGDVPKVYAEKKIQFQKELSVLVARGKKDANLAVYPVIETIQVNGRCNIALAPAGIEPSQYREAGELAHEVVSNLEGAGVFAVEMFLTEDNQILVNEIAPRVHNSGHLTMEANVTSQFEQHIRAISGLPLGSPSLVTPAVMVNILGERNGPVQIEGRDRALAVHDAHLHIYGKQPTRVERKMGHITVRAANATRAMDLAIKARKEISI